jgi:hypothetical protein
MTATARQPAGQTLARSLLLPGPQPPLSHLGATLMRHVVGAVVRYSLYQLGLPMPEAAPVRILRLRVFLDSAPLSTALAGEPAGREILDALLHPGGAGELDPASGRVRAAAALHRTRLATLGLRRGRAAAVAGEAVAAAPSRVGSGSREPGGARSNTADPTPSEPAAGRSREELWGAVCSVVAGRMPYLCDAALGELVATLGRRRLRLAGKTLGPALGQVAWQVHQGRDADLRALGAPDPLLPSWQEAGIAPEEARARALRARGEARLPGRSGRRGAFREAYRFVVSEARPLLLELGARAREEGIVEAADDVFFLPFDLGSALAGGDRPSWLGAAVAANRREHQALQREPEHDHEIEGPPALAPLRDRSADWDIAPLLPVD